MKISLVLIGVCMCMGKRAWEQSKAKLVSLQILFNKCFGSSQFLIMVDNVWPLCYPKIDGIKVVVLEGICS